MGEGDGGSKKWNQMILVPQYFIDCWRATFPPRHYQILLTMFKLAFRLFFFYIRLFRYHLHYICVLREAHWVPLLFPSQCAVMYYIRTKNYYQDCYSFKNLMSGWRWGHEFRTLHHNCNFFDFWWKSGQYQQLNIVTEYLS